MLIYVVTSPMIRKRFFQCFLLNGLIFIGSIILLNSIIIPVFVFLLQCVGFSATSTEWAEFAVDKLYKAIWVLPLYIFSFVANSLWYQDIAQQAHFLFTQSRHEEEKSMTKLLQQMHKKQNKHIKSNLQRDSLLRQRQSPVHIQHKNGSHSLPDKYHHYHQTWNNNKLPRDRDRSSSLSSSPSNELATAATNKNSRSSTNLLHSIQSSINEEIYHTLFLVVFNIQILVCAKLGTLLSMIAWSLSYPTASMVLDYIGTLVAFFLFCWQHAFLSFEYKWMMDGKPLHSRMKYFEQRVPYFSGFGAPLTLLVLIAPQFISTGIYALTFPLFIIQAIESEPIYKASNNNAGEVTVFGYRWTLFASSSSRSSSSQELKKPLRIPVFATTQWLQYAVIW
eukprot:CAMPEP_0202690388 /NCGR_PEP_ID=MMETSP1385-20130828/5387_1 /ASSEMBLY_ACC=CAM_ASM_000861 /TAXON_ID=933848 /ORGANISM="Elphidium margaritaceum" /LENGTH=392 /DNA_ID=CAMNT_0049345649 /DNA_START=1 /DNA_END=1176 /DNA_ORIENTATION=-